MMYLHLACVKDKKDLKSAITHVYMHHMYVPGIGLETLPISRRKFTVNSSALIYTCTECLSVGVRQV